MNILYVANLYPTTQKPFFGTFVKKSFEAVKKLNKNTEKLVLPEFGRGIKGYFKFYLAVFKRVASYRGIVYVHYVSHSVLPVLLARIFNSEIQVVLHYHGSDAFPEEHESTYRVLLKSGIAKWANHYADLLVSPSQTFANMLTKKFSIRDVIVSPSGGVDSQLFYSEKKISGQSPVSCLFAGRMIKGKGGLTACLAVKKAFEEGSDLTATFVGEGPELMVMRAELQKYIDLGKVRFIGLVEQNSLAELFRKHDIFLFPSTRKGESLGLVVVEAMMCSAIPITIDNGAVKELIPDEYQELLVSQDSEFERLFLALLGKDRAFDEMKETLAQSAQKYEQNFVAKNLLKEFKRL
ncbi:glycosyltransferase family 4 protein [Thalassotalea litorea]|uniref:glycosyltransferase family 4 protein n=1 Tax=Thalassotalea litorea TaxID=2020715 RepID=UPI0037370C0E